MKNTDNTIYLNKGNEELGVVKPVRLPHCVKCNRVIRYNKPNKICYDCDKPSKKRSVSK